MEATLPGFVPRGPSVEAHPGQSSDTPARTGQAAGQPSELSPAHNARAAKHRCGATGAASKAVLTRHPSAVNTLLANSCEAASHGACRFSTFLKTTLMLSMLVRIKHSNRHILRSVPCCPSETAFLRGCLRTVISDGVFHTFTVPPAHSIALSALSAGYEDLEKSTEQGPEYLWSMGQCQVYKAQYRLFAWNVPVTWVSLRKMQPTRP